VFPLADVLDFKVDPDMYRMAVGVLELVCGIILAMIPGIANWSAHMPNICFVVKCECIILYRNIFLSRSMEGVPYTLEAKLYQQKHDSLQ